MTECSPQRYLANNRNIVRGATLEPSSVEAVEDSVYEVPIARSGTAQCSLTGLFDGSEDAVYDVQVTDDELEEALISAPIFRGVGSGRLSDIAASGPAQKFTVSLKQTGLPLRAASIEFEGVTLQARQGGDAGNGIHITVDQSELVFTAQNYSLLEELRAGQGGPNSGLEGPQFDFGAAVLGSDNQIPLNAPRLTFGDDESVIYLHYKKYVDGKYLYYFAPELKRDVPAGAIINYVTGGRTVEIALGSQIETYEDVATQYDLLNQIKNASLLVEVVGPVANDRSPTGQAARELVTRTDAHFLPSYGTGSDAALAGFADVSVQPGASTERIEATCVAVTPNDHPLASPGRERWSLKGSLSGDLGIIVTGTPFSNDDFGLTVRTVLPYGFGEQRGRFTHVRTDYMPRTALQVEPPICPVALTLGPAAVDQTITLTYTKRPSGACLCADMPVPNLETECLGFIDRGGAADMAYSQDAIDRLKALYDLAARIAAQLTRYKAGLARDGIPDQSESFSDAEATPINNEMTGAINPGPTTSEELSATMSGAANTREYLLSSGAVGTHYADAALPPNFQECLDFYESAIAEIDKVASSPLKSDGFTQWDLALEELDADIPASGVERLATMALAKYKILVRQAMAYAGIPQLGKSDASTIESGDGCWRDTNDPYYWTVVGSENGAYAPLFNNTPYYSSRRASERGSYFSTHEFALQLNIKCPQYLLEGDVVILSIGGSGWASTYRIGDKLILGIIGAAPLFLAGGQDESLVQKWYADGSVSGPLAPYDFDPDAPVPYSSGGSPAILEFTIVEGGIPFANGDSFEFSSEGGHFRWRVDEGAWSSPLPIPAEPLLLEHGLYVAFTTGASPSFVADDTFRFRAVQPWAVSNLQSPTPERWQWGAVAAPSVVIDPGEDVELDGACASLHTLAEGATLTIEGGMSPGVYDWAESIDVAGAGNDELLPLSQTRTARYLRASLTGAENAGIGWLWLGMMLATTRAASVTPRRKYAVSRATGGLYTGGRYLGKAKGADVDWKTGSLYDADVEELEALLDHVKSNDDEPFVFVPNVERPREAMIVQVVEDEIDLHDDSDGNRLPQFQRRFDAHLSLAGVLQ